MMADESATYLEDLLDLEDDDLDERRGAGGHAPRYAIQALRPTAPPRTPPSTAPVTSPGDRPNSKARPSSPSSLTIAPISSPPAAPPSTGQYQRGSRPLLATAMPKATPAPPTNASTLVRTRRTNRPEMAPPPAGVAANP